MYIFSIICAYQRISAVSISRERVVQAVDSIILKGLEFMACHGVLPEEKSEPQPFLIDVQLYLDLRAAAASDDLARGVDYSRVYQSIEAVVQGSPLT